MKAGSFERWIFAFSKFSIKPELTLRVFGKSYIFKAGKSWGQIPDSSKISNIFRIFRSFFQEDLNWSEQFEITCENCERKRMSPRLFSQLSRVTQFKKIPNNFFSRSWNSPSFMPISRNLKIIHCKIKCLTSYDLKKAAKTFFLIFSITKDKL